MHARIAKYSYTGDVHEIARMAEEGILPIFQSQPGFKAYTVVDTGERIVSFSSWESAEAAEAANTAAADWVAQNLGDRIELVNSSIGEVLFSTVLGVSTKAGATA